ncbi:MAG: YgiT-type zinc finger protein [Deltaproteobacteria bacterium]|nr:YgiT-type zinc finger protein [Deltaproteobacteria bacterium]MBI2181055.1 YgiT-type zinc finger protein [Deltaproteobacteria bacterium]MBI2365651.1 YgiT-type zinc finger protein [Deltaproteobacteria bacterium]MBI3063363.1 YgiT-type zinc finger protein [Deltaproteobacteria bacterium]
MKTSALRHCPNCGSRSIKRVRKPFRAKLKARLIVVPDVEREICPECKEEYFGREASIAIDAFCFGKSRQRA